jgi:NADPH:quinone reductase-like Zn-dependent oxidoreductase
MLRSRLGRQRVRVFIARTSRENLARVAELVEHQGLAAVVDRTYALDDVGQAVADLVAGRIRGTAVITPG